MNFSLPGPAGQKHTECLGSQAFPACVRVGSTCSRLPPVHTLHVSDVQEMESKSDRIPKQLLYMTHVPVKHRDK